MESRLICTAGYARASCKVLASKFLISLFSIMEPLVSNDDTELYRNLLESTAMPLWILDDKTLCVLDANNAACTLYGYSREEMVGKSARELRPIEEVTRFEKFVAQEIIQGDAGSWTHKRKDGTTFMVNIRYHAIEYKGCRARFVIVIPVR